jgi:hypothetical protein
MSEKLKTALATVLEEVEREATALKTETGDDLRDLIRSVRMDTLMDAAAKISTVLALVDAAGIEPATPPV